MQAAALLALLHACHGEIDFPNPADVSECRQMWHVQAGKVGFHGGSDRLAAFTRQMRRYNSIFKRLPPGPQRDRQKWLREIGVFCDRPAHFPTRLRWAERMARRNYSRQASCRAVVLAALAFLEEPGTNPHPNAKHYGGNCAHRRGACDPPPDCATLIKVRRSWRQVYYNYWKCPRVRGVVGAGVARGRRP